MGFLRNLFKKKTPTEKVTDILGDAMDAADAGRFDKALQLIEEATALLPEMDVDLARNKASAFLQVTRARAYWGMGRKDESRQVFMAAVAALAPGAPADDEGFFTSVAADIAGRLAADGKHAEGLKVADEVEVLVARGPESPWKFALLAKFYEEFAASLIGSDEDDDDEDDSKPPKPLDAATKGLLIEVAGRMMRSTHADPFGFFIAAKAWLTYGTLLRYKDYSELLEILDGCINRVEQIYAERKPAPEVDFESGFMGDLQRYRGALEALEKYDGVPRPLNWLRYMKGDTLAKSGATEEAYRLFVGIHNEFVACAKEAGEAPADPDLEDAGLQAALAKAVGGKFSIVSPTTGRVSDIPSPEFYATFIEVCVERAKVGKMSAEDCLALLPHFATAIENEVDSKQEAKRYADRVNTALSAVSNEGPFMKID